MEAWRRAAGGARRQGGDSAAFGWREIGLGKRRSIWDFVGRFYTNPRTPVFMALWEYKVITSGKGGFASATMLESYLNQLGKDEWEIVDFRTDPNNSLVFHGLARRPTQREWTLEAAVAAAAKAEADKLRAELMQKQHAGDASASADVPAGSTPGDKAAGPDSLRQLRDTDRDHDPEALAEEASQGADEWANLDSFEDDLPTFFDAIKPHLRKNQNAPGQSVALNYLAKRWELPEADLNGALKECGFVIPENETEAPVYIEYEGDLYWVEKNNRGQFFLNTREKPRPKFRVTAGKPLDPADPVYVALAEEQAAIEAERAKRAAEQAAREAEAQARRAERDAQRQAAEQARREQQAAREAARASAASNDSAEATVAAPAPAPAEGGGDAAEPAGESSKPAAAPVAGGALPEGTALLDAIRPQMRRNRRGPGYSGSSSYLAKYFKVEEAALKAALAALGLVPPATPGEKAAQVVIGAYVYWVNKDNNGGLWINGREATPRDRTTPPAGGAGAAAQPAPADAADASAPASGGSASAGGEGEPPIFRAVPRAMPPIPEAEPVAAEAAPVSPAEQAAPAPEAPKVESVAEATPVAEESAGPVEPVEPTATLAAASPLAALRLVMKPNKSKTGVSGSLSFLAKAVERSEDQLLATLQAQGLVVPAEAKEGEPESKPVFVENDGEIYWINRFAKDGSLWLNAKAAKTSARKPAGKAAPKPRTKRRASSAIEADAAAEE